MFNFKEVVMVIKQKNNGKWEYCVYLGLDERGKKKYKRKSGFVTKKACVREATKIQNGENIRSYKTFEDICKLYLKDCELRFLRDTTLQLYKSRIEFIKKKFSLRQRRKQNRHTRYKQLYHTLQNNNSRSLYKAYGCSA